MKNTLRQVRLERKLTQTELGAACNIPSSRISVYEAGEPLRKVTAEKLATALRADPRMIWENYDALR